jgi:hypothetical protein
MSDEYTPTTGVVRDEWVHLEGFIIPDGVPKREAAFDRWLAAHDRQVAAKAIRDAVEWARSCSGESADAAADYIEEMAALGGEAND